MKYNILAIPDIHWGVTDPMEQLKYLDYIFTFIRDSSIKGVHIDLLVILGDYFDSKLPLNSREAIYAIQWFDDLYNICVDFGVSKIRMVQGTMDHDNDQLDVFQSYEDRIWEYQDDPDYFKIFRKTTVEETLPNLNCIYCPDETIETSEYEDKYINEIIQLKDIGFFHGSFDVVYGELLASKPEIMQKRNVVFQYNLFDKTIAGPMIAGHWHDGKIYDDLIYCGSPFRYKFNEDEIKGLSFIQYNTDDKSYVYQRIQNPVCAEYITYEVYSNMYNTNEDYANIIRDINEILERLFEKTYANHKLRIMIYMVDDKPENDIFVSSLRQLFVNQKQVKIVIKNKLKDKIKKEQVKKNKDRKDKFGFIYDKSSKPPQIIHDFILSNQNGVDIPIAYIEEKVSKYLKK